MVKLMMMVGLPYSGKSTIANELSISENAVIYSSDKLRKELFGDENDNTRNDELFKELHNRIKNSLKNNINVVFDATNISYKLRKNFLDELKRIECEKICYLIATPYEECIKRIGERERFVPEYVVKNMYLNFDVPAYFEGWNDIKIIYNDDKKLDLSELFNRLDLINQDNPHHTFTIGLHCKSCLAHLCSNTIENNMVLDRNLVNVAIFHDIGKEFTKSFKNSKGEITEIAHYFNHHNVSAYNTLFYLKEDEDILDICQLIRWHMQPFFISSEKSKRKFIKLVGQEFYDRIMILHEADKNAK